MTFRWYCRTDEEIIARVRYWHPMQMKWRRAIYGLIALLIVLLLTIFIGEFPIISHRLYAMMQAVNLRSYAAGYLAGLSFGGLLGGVLTFCVCGLFFVVADLKRDRLLLTYHDRLHQAGLLPGEVAETMECTAREPWSS